MTPEQRAKKRQQFLNKTVDLCSVAEDLYEKAYAFVTTKNTAVFELASEDIPHCFRRVQAFLNMAKEIFKEC